MTDHNDEDQLRLYAKRHRDRYEAENGHPHPSSFDETLELLRKPWSLLSPEVRRTINTFGRMRDGSKPLKQ